MTGCIPGILPAPGSADGLLPGLVLFSLGCDLFCDVGLTPLPHSLDPEIAEGGLGRYGG